MCLRQNISVIEMSRSKGVETEPDGGIFRTFHETCLSAKNLFKVAARIEVTQQKSSRAVKLHDDAMSAYERHADIFIRCGNGGMGSSDEDPYGYRFIRADFPRNITKDHLLASTLEQLLDGEKIWKSSTQLVKNVRTDIMPHWAPSKGVGTNKDDLRSGFNIEAVVDRIKKRLYILEKAEKNSAINLNCEKFVNGHDNVPIGHKQATNSMACIFAVRSTVRTFVPRNKTIKYISTRV